MGKNKGKEVDSSKSSIQHDAFLSKNRKRKERRLAQKLTTKIETEDFIPVKKSILTPLNKVKSEVKKNNWEPPSKSKKTNILLSMSLPIEGSKKEESENANNSVTSLTSVFNKKKPKKLTSILSNPNTCKLNKKERVTFGDEKHSVTRFIDNEAEEGEEPITGKVVEPYEKRNKKIKPQIESSDESGDSTVEIEDYLDMEASEGEETDVEDDDKSNGTDTNDSDDFSDENTYISSFVNDDESESAKEDEGSENKYALKTEKVKLRKIKQKGTVSTPSEKPLIANQKKIEVELRKCVSPKTLLKTEQNSANKTKVNKLAQEKAKKKEENEISEKESKKKVSNEKFEKPSNFIGFIHKVPNSFTENEVKSALSKTLHPDNILLVKFAKIRKQKSIHNVFVYLKDSESLDKIINIPFSIGDASFTVCRARASEKTEFSAPVAFLPRVPLWIKNEQLKEVIENHVGTGKIIKIENKKFSEKLQSRNVLMHFADTDALKEAIYKGKFNVKDHSVIVREALEGMQIEVHRAVFANLPEKTDEATLKEVLETNIGKNTVKSIQFSFRKKSFAFVVFKNEQAQNKALALEDFSLKGTKLKVLPYKPRKPKKRVSPNENTKEEVIMRKKQKLELADDTNPKKLKEEGLSKFTNSPSKHKNNGSKFQQKKQGKGLSNISTSTSLNKQKIPVPQKISPRKRKQTSETISPNPLNLQKKKLENPSITTPTGEVIAIKNLTMLKKKEKSSLMRLSPLKKKIEDKRKKSKSYDSTIEDEK